MPALTDGFADVMHAHPRQDLFFVDGFRDVVHASDLQSGDLVPHVIHSGQEDDGDIG
ncbi:MAG: hypothetical protein ABSH49_28560 [Bryobacteraceae bacterium]